MTRAMHTRYVTLADEEIATPRDGVIKLHGEAAFAGMRRAGALAAAALDMIEPFVVPGAVTAEIDARRIRRILRNLVTNAIEHGEGRPIVVRIAADDEGVAVTVRDHGVGFRADQSRAVFHRFWRADPSRARRVGGTGLGLSISLEDAHLHRGWLGAWGRPGRGAQFRLTLPRRHDVPLRTSPLALTPADVLDTRDATSETTQEVSP